MKLTPLSLTLFALLFALPAAPQDAVAQDGRDNPLDPQPSRKQVLIGPRFGLTRNYHTGNFRIIEDPNCPLFTDGTGWGYLVGLTAEFLPNLNGTWGIIPAVTFEQRPAQFTEDLPNAKVLLPNDADPENPTIVDQTVSTLSDITYTLLNIEVLYKQELALLGDLRFSVLAGPAFQYVLAGTKRQTQTLDQPLEAVFKNPRGLETEDEGRTLIFGDGDIEQRSGSRFSVKAGAQGEIGLFNNDWILTPGVFYDYGLTDVTPTESWQLHSVIFQVDLRRAF